MTTADLLIHQAVTAAAADRRHSDLLAAGEHQAAADVGALVLAQLSVAVMAAMFSVVDSDAADTTARALAELLADPVEVHQVICQWAEHLADAPVSDPAKSA